MDKSLLHSRLLRIESIERKRVNEEFARRQEVANREFRAMFAKKTCSICGRACKAFRFLKPEDVVCATCADEGDVDADSSVG